MDYKYQKVCQCGKVFATENNNQYLCDKCEKDKKDYYKHKSMYKGKKHISHTNLRIPKTSYEYGVFTINSETIRSFDLIDNRRRVSNSHVNKLKRILRKGIHFESPIIINMLEGKMRLIDGNHRIEAISQIIEKNPEFEIDVLLIKYQKIGPDEELEVFKRWNSGKPQSKDDLVQSVVHKMRFYSYVQTQFPVGISIYHEKDCLRISVLCNAILAAKKGSETGRGIERDTFEEDLKSLDKGDYDFAEEWMKIFSELFDKPVWGNKHYGATFLNATTYLAYQYWTDKRIHDMKIFLENKVKGVEKFLELAKIGKREATTEMINIMRKKTFNLDKIKA